MLSSILWIYICCLVGMNALYALIHYRLISGLKRLPFPQPPSPLKNPTVSVIIAIRNEEDVLHECLDSLISQDYPESLCQFILVNDRSTDKTPEILRRYSVSHPGRFTIINISEKESSFSPKKYAIHKGLDSSTGDIIFSTDADCRFGSKWISSTVSQFSSKTGIVLGATSYYHPQNLKKMIWGMQALEFFSYTIVSSSLVANRFPINSNANNMAYQKQAYLEAGGFSSNQHIVSGDDDFLLQRIAALKTWEVKFNCTPESQVETRPNVSISEIWEQRKRWASKCALYAPKQVLFLSFVYIYFFSILIFCAAGLFSSLAIIVGTLSWLIKTGLDYFTLARGIKLFHQQHLLRWFLPAAIFQIPLIVFAVLFGSLGRFTWKGQTVKRTITRKP